MNLKRQKTYDKRSIYHKKTQPQTDIKKSGQKQLELCLAGSTDVIGQDSLVLFFFFKVVALSYLDKYDNIFSGFASRHSCLIFISNRECNINVFSHCLCVFL